MINVLNAIPYGKENAISKSELIALTGLSERQIRQQIKELNAQLTKEGTAILSSSQYKGYWKSKDIAEMKAYIRESKHRQQALMKNDAPIQNLIYKTEGVNLVPVKAHFRRIELKK